MRTLRLLVEDEALDSPVSMAAFTEAAGILRAGGTVALPTETVYGLGANALDGKAVAKIFEAKGRPGWDPLIVHVCDEAMLARVVRDVPQAARKLMEAFWPGPLTLLLERSEQVPDAVTARRPLVGVRMPAHPVALRLIQMAGVPIAAPSANVFGHTSPTSAQHVLEDLDGRIDAVVVVADAGVCCFGLESTVVDASRSPMVIYRPGAVTLEDIRAAAGAVEMFSEEEVSRLGPRESLPSPGVGLRHYAPRARLILLECDGDESAVQAALRERVREIAGERVGVLWPGRLDAFGEGGDGDPVRLYGWGKWDLPEALGMRLFAGLRELDAEGCEVILCALPSAEGIGVAIRDRLRKAAFAKDQERG